MIKPKIRFHTVRTGYRGTIRGKIWYLDWFGIIYNLNSLQDGFWLVEHLLGLK